MTQGFWIVKDGEKILLPYDEIDPELYPTFFKPVGGFCFPAGAYLHMELTEAPFYLKDWLPKQGRLEIYAPNKTGKSFLAVQLARCIGQGEEFLGLPTKKGTVLYLQHELSEAQLQSRMRGTGQDYEGIYVGTTYSMKIDQQGGQQQLETALSAVRPDVLIIDPLYKVMSGDENESSEMKVVTDYLDSIVEAYGCSVVIFHHMGKDSSKGGRGSVLLADWVDSYVEMKKISKKGEPLRIRVMPQALRHAACPPEPTEAMLEDNEFRIVREGDKPKNIRAEIAELLASDRSAVWTVKALAASLSTGNRGTITNHLNALVKEGLTQRRGRGEYQWIWD